MLGAANWGSAGQHSTQLRDGGLDSTRLHLPWKKRVRRQGVEIVRIIGRFKDEGVSGAKSQVPGV